MGRARDLANILSSSGNVALDSELGLSLITPTSIAATGGSGSISTTGAVSFTSASAISLNGCFSSSYQNYRVQINGTSASTLLNWQAKMRLSGTDSTANYYSSEFWVSSAGSTGIGSYVNNGGFFQINTNDNSNGACPTWFDIFRPFDAAVTNVLGQGYDGSAGKSKYFGGLHNASTSYDGLTIASNTGTISGTIRVYGYKN
jgi:hypothetical protein